MPRFATVLAALVVLACAVLLLRLVLRPRLRARFDASAAAAWWRLRSLPARLRRARRRGLEAVATAEAEAAREAQAAIERARHGDAERDGNVIRPKSFRGPRKLH